MENENATTSINMEVTSVGIMVDKQPFLLTAKTKSVKYSDGDILISILLSILILIQIFGGIHNVIFGVKTKKQNYD